jgi:hypothetical protein
MRDSGVFRTVRAFQTEGSKGDGRPFPLAKRVAPACQKSRSGMPTGWSRFAISLILPRNLTDFAVQSH